MNAYSASGVGFNPFFIKYTLSILPFQLNSMIERISHHETENSVCLANKVNQVVMTSQQGPVYSSWLDTKNREKFSLERQKHFVERDIKDVDTQIQTVFTAKSRREKHIQKLTYNVQHSRKTHRTKRATLHAQIAAHIQDVISYEQLSNQLQQSRNDLLNIK